MSVTDVRKDQASKTMTITSEFDQPVERRGSCEPTPGNSSSRTDSPVTTGSPTRTGRR